MCEKDVLPTGSESFEKEVKRLRFELNNLNKFVFEMESRLKECRENCQRSEHSENATCAKLVISNISNFDDFISYLLCQQGGIFMGSGITLSGYIFDRGFASYCAKKYGIKQKYVSKLLFPTIICIIQILLRKRNKESKLAAFLSNFKYSKNGTSPINRNRKRNERDSLTSINLRPQPFVSNNIRSAQSDSVFTLSSKKTKSKSSNLSSKSIRHHSLPQVLTDIVVQNRKNSIVSIPINSVEYW